MKKGSVLLRPTTPIWHVEKKDCIPVDLRERAEDLITQLQGIIASWNKLRILKNAHCSLKISIEYVQNGIRNAPEFGSGNGPIRHF